MNWTRYHLRAALLVIAWALTPASSAWSQSARPDATAGRVTVLSSIGQPLSAQVELGVMSSEQYAKLDVRLAPKSVYAEMGWQYSPVLATVRGAVEKDRRGNVSVRLTTRDPVNEPLSIVLESRAAEGAWTRRIFTALPSPVVAAAPKAPAERPAAAKLPAEKKPSALVLPSGSRFASAQPFGRETLEQAIARAVQFFPEMQAALSRREAVSAQTGQARGELFPSINLSAGEGREQSRNVSTRGLGRDPTLTRQEADVTISQLVFDGGASYGQVKRFGARRDGAAFTVNDTAETVAARAGVAFTEVRRLREQLAIARENLATHERTLSDVTDLANSGRGRRADVIQSEARRALAVSAVEQLVGQLGQAEATYKNLTGRMPGTLDAPPDFGPKLPGRADEAVAAALSGHPAVRAAEKELEAAQYDRESAQARLAIPRVTVEAGASRNRDLDGIAGPNYDRYAMLRFRYNLFRGLGDSERVREAAARMNEAFAGLDRVRNDVERDVRQAWELLSADRVRLPVLASYARASSDVAEAYRLQFQLGQRSLLDVLNAENESFNARSSFVAGREAVTAGELRLLASTGRLLDTLGIAPPAAIQKDPDEPK